MQHDCDLDVADKHHAQGIDDLAHQLRNRSCKIGFHPGIEKHDNTFVPTHLFTCIGAVRRRCSTSAALLWPIVYLLARVRSAFTRTSRNTTTRCTYLLTYLRGLWHTAEYKGRAAAMCLFATLLWPIVYLLPRARSAFTRASRNTNPALQACRLRYLYLFPYLFIVIVVI